MAAKVKEREISRWSIPYASGEGLYQGSTRDYYEVIIGNGRLILMQERGVNEGRIYTQAEGLFKCVLNAVNDIT